MSLFTADSPVLKIEGLETKFDRAIVSNSLVIALGGNHLAARILQQLHYCCHAGYGVVIEGVRWIYKPIREFVSEMLVGFTNWQIRKAIAFLVEIGVVRKEHLYHIHHGHNYAPKNRTLYYSLDYDQLEEIIREFLEKRQKAETVESISFVSPTKPICESYTELICEPRKTNTKNTSIENNQRKIPLPNPSQNRAAKSELKSEPNGGGDNSPSISSKKKPITKRKCTQPQVKLSQVIARHKKPVSVNKAVEIEANNGDVEQKVNRFVSTTPMASVQEYVQQREVVQEPVQQPVVEPSVQVEPEPKLEREKTRKGTKSKKRTHDHALWETMEERNSFERELTRRVVNGVGKARNPMALVRYVLNQITQGCSHPYWEEWKAGIVIGTCETQEWEASPGNPYPKFVEYLVEKLKYDDESRSQAQFRLGKILDDVSKARLHWREFKRILEGLRQDAEKAAANGQQVALPVWFIERTEISLERAGESAQKLTQLAPEQTDWIYRGLPESEKLLTAAANLLQPGIPELPPGEPESKPPEITVIPDPWAGDNDNDEDDFCFNGFIDMGYLEQQAKKVAANPGKLGLLLMDFKSAVAQATKNQREKIRRMLTPIYPELLDYL